jgi:hypothetical protein
MTSQEGRQGWESVGTVATPTGTVAFADTQVLGEGFVLAPELLVESGTVAGLSGSVYMVGAPADRPLLVERYFDDRGAVSAVRVLLASAGGDGDGSESVPDESTELDATGEWEEMGALNLIRGSCMAGDPRRKGSGHRIPLGVRPGRYGVERLVVRAGEAGDESVTAFRIRIQGQRKPSSQRRG